MRNVELLKRATPQLHSNFGTLHFQIDQCCNQSDLEFYLLRSCCVQYCF